MQTFSPTLVASVVAVTLLSLLRASGAERPRVAVVITVDQLRADYLARFRPWFGEGGFRRLLEGGAVFEECHYRHAVTKTGPGHATILSGAHPAMHGIVGNEWFDHQAWQVMGSVEDVDSPLVGLPAGEVAGYRAGRSPRNFQATTVGDQAKLRLGAAARVFAVANKDRSAILMGGKLADGVYWQHDGRMISSRFYGDAVPDWVEAFNAAGHVDGFRGQPWTRLVDVPAYDLTQGPDEAPGEKASASGGSVFPYLIEGGEAPASESFLAVFDGSPFSSDVLTRFAEQLIAAENIGQTDGLDLLGIGFSQLDRVGHDYGPDSHEVMDSVLRLDRCLARFFATLDRVVGAGRWVTVLTADHGVAPLPERVHATRSSIPAGRLDGRGLDTAVQAALDDAFGPLPERMAWCRRDNFGYHFFPPALRAKNISLADAAKVVQRALEAWPQIAHAFTGEEILGWDASGESLPAALRRSYFAGRSQDVVFVLHPYVIDWSRATGTNHGSPYAYDTHVPLLWYGPGVPIGTHVDRVGVDDLAPTLAALLGVPPPPQATGRRLF